MEGAGEVRGATFEAVRDVEPERLRAEIRAHIDDGWMAPAMLTLACGRGLDAGVDADDLRDRATGVQLIYEGLRLTRRLAHENPWADDDGAKTTADLEVLMADVLVARGAYLLSYTEAAGEAVRIIQAFGRDQTVALESGRSLATDRELEADVLGLAAIAGTTAARPEPVARMTEWAADLGRSLDGDLPEETIFLSRAEATAAERAVVADDGGTTTGTDR